MCTNIKKEQYLEEARRLVENNGGKLISVEYIDSETNLDFKCACGNTYSLVLIKLRASKGFCPICRYDRSISNKYDTNFVKEIFLERGCVLLSEYIDYPSPLSFICKCGRKDKRPLYKFIEYGECKECKKEFIRKNKLLQSYSKAVAELDDNGCKMISSFDEYDGIHSKIRFVCKCGTPFEKRWDVLRKSFRCNECAQEFTRISSQTSYEEVVDYIISKGCEIVTSSEEYNGSNKAITIRCGCGKTYETRFCYFKHENKIRCNECSLAAHSGENSPWWKGGITLDSDSLRDSADYGRWRRDVYKKDGYRCACCGSTTNLAAHHINNFASCVELRLDIDNGVTLCDACHNPNKYGSFHNIYGIKNNNQKQLYEYIEQYKAGSFKTIRLANLIKKTNMGNNILQ